MDATTYPDLVNISNNLGDTKSLITHPSTTTHRRLGVEGRQRAELGDNTLRISVGMEDYADIEGDLLQVLDDLQVAAGYVPR